MKLHFRPRKLNQSGFDHVFLVVIVVVFIAILGTFYVVYSRAATSNYPIVNANGKCLNNEKDLAVAKNSVEIYTCNDNGAQDWTVKNATIVNSNGFCLAAQGRVSGKYVVIQRCDGSALQGWTVDKTAKKIVSKPSGLCLDVEAGSSEDKALTQVKTCNGSQTQKWTVQDASTAAPTISSFTANPTSVNSGKTTTLSWDYNNANKCSVTPGGPTNTTAKSWTSGALTANTTFTLSCQQDSGTAATATTSVKVTTATTEKFGMSAPDAKWDERLAQVGGPAHVKYRRIFLTSFDGSMTKVKESINAGMTPVISWKTGSYSWKQVAQGAADAKLKSIVTQLNAIPGKKILVIHHEPAQDGTAADYAAMQLHALPILKTANNVEVGVIANGWWWSARSNGYSDSEIAQWIPASLKSVCDFIAADTYQDENLNEDGSVKAKRMAEWARRTGGVSQLGIGEFNGWNASAITNVMNVVKAEPLFKWALVWNSGPTGLGIPLDGARLTAFKEGILTSNQL